MDPFALVFPTIAGIFVVGVVAGGLVALFQTRNARRGRMEMKRPLRGRVDRPLIVGSALGA
jgi:hypothetical protein